MRVSNHFHVLILRKIHLVCWNLNVSFFLGDSSLTLVWFLVFFFIDVCVIWRRNYKKNIMLLQRKMREIIASPNRIRTELQKVIQVIKYNLLLAWPTGQSPHPPQHLTASLRLEGGLVWSRIEQELSLSTRPLGLYFIPNKDDKTNTQTS